MAASPQNLPNAGHFYSNIVKPIDINLQFTVDNTNGNGITSLKSNGYVNAVYMHCATTASAANPNPAAGYALIKLAGNYNTFIGLSSSIQEPYSGSDIKIDNGATLTIGSVYTITTLGNATAAQWSTVGVPAGIAPAVGVSFVAIATGAGSGNTSTSRVQTSVVSGISGIEIVGNPTASLNNSNVSSNAGGQIIVKFLAATNSGTTTLIPTAPAAGSVISLRLRLDGSSVTVDGL